MKTRILKSNPLHLINRATAIFLLLLALTVAASAEPVSTPHNILLLIADDFGIDNLSLYNTNASASIPSTPNLTALGQSGVAFTHFYARPSCSQSRACIITGRDSFRTGVGVAIGGAHTPVLRSNEYTLPRAFTTNAPRYALASFGKWHLGGTSTNIYDTDSPRLTGGWTNYAGFYSPGVASYFNWTKWSNGVSVNTTNYSTSDQVNDATNFIVSQGTNLWFTWLAFNAPHAPRHKPPTNLLTTQAYIDLSGKSTDISTNGRAYYEAMIQALDTEIGRLLTVVNRTNTDIIFIGDNGTEVDVQQPPFKNASVAETTLGNGHAKFTIFEGGARTPLFITGPDVASPGRYNDTLVNEPDLFSTIQELAGINVAATLPTNVVIDSVSLLPALRADVIRPTPFVIEEQFNQSTASDGVTLRNGQFKLVHFYNHTNDFSNERFYDLGSDPYEFTNLLTAPLAPAAQSNYYSLRLNFARYITLANTNYTRNLFPYPAVSNAVFSNGAFQVNERYTQWSTNVNTPAFAALAVNTNYPLDYTLTLWRSSELNNPLAWVPVATNVITPGTENALLITNTVLTDANANADHYFYQVTPYVP